MLSVYMYIHNAEYTYRIYYTMYVFDSVEYTLYSVHCTLYIIQYEVYNVHSEIRITLPLS